MLRLAAMLAFAAAGFAVEPGSYELSGETVPPMRARVTLFGATEPFTTSAFLDLNGHFRFKHLRPGLYTLAIFSRRRGEARRTVEVGPALADGRGRVRLRLELEDSDFAFASLADRNLVSARQLAVSQAALREYDEARKNLSQSNAAAAVKHLERAVGLAPEFSAAWNSLGVIAYQTHQYGRAEECFHKAVDADAQSYEALVNLGGVKLTLHKLDAAIDYNLKAVLARPNDPLANAQLGLTYFSLGQFDLAAKYLERTRQLDPVSFTYPQLMLFEIHFRRGDRSAAAADLEDFLTHHPGWGQAAKMRETITGLRSAGP